MTIPVHSITASELAERLRGTLRGDGSRAVARVAPLEVAEPDCVAWLGDARYLPQLRNSRAGVVLVSAKILAADAATDERAPTLIVVADADMALCEVLRWLSPPPPRVPSGVHPTAVVDATANVRGAAIGPHAYVGPNARIGAGTQIHAGVYVGAETTIGVDCTLWPNVVVRERIQIGDRVIVHPNATIGADGFGYLFRNGAHVKIPQTGTVVIEDDVEIGAGTAIDRARSGETRIGRGTKIDNLVQIGHNTSIGEHCVIVAQCGISGSCVIEHHAVFAGQTGVVDHVRIGAGAQVAVRTLVMRDVEAGSSVLGYPEQPSREFFRQQVLIRKLPEISEQLRALAKRVEQIESAADDRKGS